LSAGAFILLQGPHPPKVRADMECVKSIATDYEDYCVYCCKNSWPTQIATYITDGSLGSWCYTTGSVNCGGVSDHSNCTASQCGTFQYSSDYQSSYCCGGSYSPCTTDGDCCPPLTCSGNFCANVY